MAKIEGWAVVTRDATPYQAPECWAKAISGKIYEHPIYKDGESILTSAITAVREMDDGRVLVLTASGSMYELGEVAAEYEKVYPRARERLLSAWKT